MFILEVTPIAKSSHADTLSYFSVKKVDPGGIVEVPLRKQNVLAVVMSVNPVTNIKSQIKSAGYSLRNIHKIIEGQLYSKALLATTYTLKDYFCIPQGKITNLLSPKFLQENQSLWKKRSTHKKRAIKKQMLMRPFPERIDYYKSFIREKRSDNESLIIVCPTTHECEELFYQLNKNTTHVFYLHSGISKKKRVAGYAEITERESSSVLITTPSFIDTPLFNLTTLILEHESSPQYIAAAQHLDLRVVIDTFARYVHADVIYADSIIRPERWYEIEKKYIERIEPFQNVLRDVTNRIEVEQLNVPITKKITDTERIAQLNKQVAEFSTLSKKSHSRIKKSIKDKENIFIFSSRKSLAPSIICNDCGNIVVSQKTGRPYSLFNKKSKHGGTTRVFRDPLTKEVIPAYDNCMYCKGNRLVQLGVGTERIYDDLKQYQKNATIIILDDNHKLLKKERAELSSLMKDTKHPVIVISTSKGFSLEEKFDNAIVASLDSMLGRPHQNVVTECLWVLSSILRMTMGSVYIQSRNITENQLAIIYTGRYQEFIQRELQLRKELDLPPYLTKIYISKEIQKIQLKKVYAFIQELFQKEMVHTDIMSGRKKSTITLRAELTIPKGTWNPSYQEPELLLKIKELARTWNIEIEA